MSEFWKMFWTSVGIQVALRLIWWAAAVDARKIAREEIAAARAREGR